MATSRLQVSELRDMDIPPGMAVIVAAKYTDKAWDGSKARFTMDELMHAVPKAVREWAQKQAGDGEVSKSDCKLPYKEPDGTINMNAVRNALARLSQTDLPDDVKAAAKAELESVMEKGKKAMSMGTLESSPVTASRFFDQFEPEGDSIQAAQVDPGLGLQQLIDIIRRQFDEKFNGSESGPYCYSYAYSLREIFDESVVCTDLETGKDCMVPYTIDDQLDVTFGEMKPVRVTYMELANAVTAAASADSLKIQSLLFDKSKFTAERAKKWAKDHGHKAPKVDTTGKMHRLRQFSPEDCVADSYATIELTDGIKAVMCKMKPGKKASTIKASRAYISSMSISFNPSADASENRRPFEGVLFKVDTPSDGAPHGTDGLRLIIPRAVAQKAAETIAGQPINAHPEFTDHDIKSNIGVFTGARIDGDEFIVTGYTFGYNMAEEMQNMSALQHDLGMSFEGFAITTAEERDGEMYAVAESMSLCGGTVLYKDLAAYKTTRLLAAKHDPGGTMNDKELLDKIESTVKAAITPLDERLKAVETKASATSAPVVTETKLSPDVQALIDTIKAQNAKHDEQIEKLVTALNETPPEPKTRRGGVDTKNGAVSGSEATKEELEAKIAGRLEARERISASKTMPARERLAEMDRIETEVITLRQQLAGGN